MYRYIVYIYIIMYIYIYNYTCVYIYDCVTSTSMLCIHS